MLGAVEQSYYAAQSACQQDMASMMAVGLLASVSQSTQRLPDNGDGLVTDAKDATDD